MKVLLADDDSDWLTLFERKLTRNGYEVVCVGDADGVEAEAAGAEVLVIDVMLGEPLTEYLGVVAVGRLLNRDRDPIAPHVPILFISILGENDAPFPAKLRELKIPPDRYVWLQKPIEETRLIDVIVEQSQARAGSSNA